MKILNKKYKDIFILNKYCINIYFIIINNNIIIFIF